MVKRYVIYYLCVNVKNLMNLKLSRKLNWKSVNQFFGDIFLISSLFFRLFILNIGVQVWPFSCPSAERGENTCLLHLTIAVMVTPATSSPSFLAPSLPLIHRRHTPSSHQPSNKSLSSFILFVKACNIFSFTMYIWSSSFFFINEWDFFYYTLKKENPVVRLSPAAGDPWRGEEAAIEAEKSVILRVKLFWILAAK